LKIGSELVHSFLEIALTTLIVLVFAEFIPRAWFRLKATHFLIDWPWSLIFFTRCSSPSLPVLLICQNGFLKYVFNIRFDKNKEAFLRTDLKHLFQPREDEERQERNTQLMENAQELPKVRSGNACGHGKK
jgi:Mg2+/Co2+ transporter CorB